MSETICRHCATEIEQRGDDWVHAENKEALCDIGDGATWEAFPKRPPMQPLRTVRLNAKYCLVKLSYFQAQQLFLAADPMRDDPASKDIGWTDLQRKALREALDKLSETTERWPQGMDV